MSTAISVISTAVQDDLRGQLETGFISDNEMAKVVGSAISRVNGWMSSYATYTIAGRVDNSVVPASTVTPEVDVDDKWGVLIRLVALWVIASGGAMLQAERNLGSYSSATHSANMTSRVTQHRMNAKECLDRVKEQIALIKGQDLFSTGEVDFTLADW